MLISYHTEIPKLLHGTNSKATHSGNCQDSSKKLQFRKFNLKFNLLLCSNTDKNISPRILSPRILFLS